MRLRFVVAVCLAGILYPHLVSLDLSASVARSVSINYWHWPLPEKCVWLNFCLSRPNLGQLNYLPQANLPLKSSALILCRMNSSVTISIINCLATFKYNMNKRNNPDHPLSHFCKAKISTKSKWLFWK